jgi:hypothetical protein
MRISKSVESLRTPVGGGDTSSSGSGSAGARAAAGAGGTGVDSCTAAMDVVGIALESSGVLTTRETVRGLYAIVWLEILIRQHFLLDNCGLYLCSFVTRGSGA